MQRTRISRSSKNHFRNRGSRYSTGLLADISGIRAIPVISLTFETLIARIRMVTGRYYSELPYLAVRLFIIRSTYRSSRDNGGNNFNDRSIHDGAWTYYDTMFRLKENLCINETFERSYMIQMIVSWCVTWFIFDILSVERYRFRNEAMQIASSAIPRRNDKEQYLWRWLRPQRTKDCSPCLKFKF